MKRSYTHNYRMVQEQTAIVAAFQTWRNGSLIQVSGLYTGDEVDDFIEKHRSGNTFATLHTFQDLNFASQMYEMYLEDIREY